jgi:hypothetical protein
MKLTAWLCGGVLIAAIGCSSSPTKNASTEVTNSKSDYIASVDKKLNDYGSRIAKLPESRASKIRADIADTRAELINLQTASDAVWQSKRWGVENRLNKIQSEYESARSE